jgi:hypothetical protein
MRMALVRFGQIRTGPIVCPTAHLSVENPSVAIDTHLSKREQPAVRGWNGSLNPGVELPQQLRSTVEENAQ